MRGGSENGTRMPLLRNRLWFLYCHILYVPQLRPSDRAVICQILDRELPNEAEVQRRVKELYINLICITTNLLIFCPLKYMSDRSLFYVFIDAFSYREFLKPFRGVFVRHEDSNVQLYSDTRGLNRDLRAQMKLIHTR